MSFIRFTPENYLLENQTECRPEYELDSICPTTDEVYMLPTKPGDQLSFIVDKEEIDPLGAQVEQLRIGLVNCGMLVPGAESIGTILEADGQYFIVVTIPLNTVDCTYNFVIYNIINPIDCGQFKGMTLGEVIATGVTLGEVLNCTLEDFIP
jgi:hypothetical protein